MLMRKLLEKREFQQDSNSKRTNKSGQFWNFNPIENLRAVQSSMSRIHVRKSQRMIDSMSCRFEASFIEHGSEAKY
uniref:Uncharacterized protein n=1 Tax=Xiphophorus couchianus TaxID=32473 RepID=A0A3B5LQB1_9TELE